MKKIMLITGASSGIGKSIADKFYDEGWTVFAAARRLSSPSKKYSVKKKKNKFLPLRLDITNKEEVYKKLSSTFKKYGFPDIMILNAGTNNPNNEKILDLEEVNHIYKVNFFGTLNCVDAILKLSNRKRMKSQLAIVSSVAGYRGLPYSAAYCSSKAALTNFAESIYSQCKLIGLNIRVINPGFIKTPLTDKNKFPMPLIISSQTAANLIYKKLLHSKSFEINLPKLFCIIMKIIKLLPYTLYFKFTSSLLKKL